MKKRLSKKPKLLKARIIGPTGKKGWCVICPKDKRECRFTPCVAQEMCNFP